MTHKREKDSLSLVAVGDVLLCRDDYMSIFSKCKHIFKAADLAFFNCETAYAESGSPGTAQHGAVPHDPSRMPALTDAGFNVCTLANNHTGDWGVEPIGECRDRLEAMGIAVCGAGRNIAEARKPAILERKGTKVAFLGYMSTGPNDYRAEEDKPGAAMVRAHTHYEQEDYQPGTPPLIRSFAYREDLAAMVEDIKKAKEQADIVVMTEHWGIHNAPVVIPDYEYEVAYAAIDAGADLILGHHPHILKGIEVYKGKVIVHSMANFIMELAVVDRGEAKVKTVRLKSWRDMNARVYRPRHPDQRKTLIVNCTIAGKKIERVSYIPVMLDADWSIPEPLPRTDPRAQEIYQYIADITRDAGLTTRFEWDGDEVVIVA